jgi:DNA-directed RNA polymerase subunit H (RpoH/RPB5)
MAVEAEAKVVDIQKHVLVPKHTILSEAEAAELLERFNVSLVQIPVIPITDPIAKAIGAKAGQIVKIEREGPTGKTLYYRRVA